MVFGSHKMLYNYTSNDETNNTWTTPGTLSAPAGQLASSFDWLFVYSLLIWTCMLRGMYSILHRSEINICLYVFAHTHMVSTIPSTYTCTTRILRWTALNVLFTNKQDVPKQLYNHIHTHIHTCIHTSHPIHTSVVYVYAFPYIHIHTDIQSSLPYKKDAHTHDICPYTSVRRMQHWFLLEDILRIHTGTFI